MTTIVQLEDHTSPTSPVSLYFGDESPALYLSLALLRGDIDQPLRDATTPLVHAARIAEDERRALGLLVIGLLKAGQVWRDATEDLLKAIDAHDRSRPNKTDRPTARERRLNNVRAGIDGRLERHLVAEDENVERGMPAVYAGDRFRGPETLNIGRMENGEARPPVNYCEPVGDVVRELSAREARALAAVLLHHADELERQR